MQSTDPGGHHDPAQKEVTFNSRSPACLFLTQSCLAPPHSPPAHLILMHPAHLALMHPAFHSSPLLISPSLTPARLCHTYLCLFLRHSSLLVSPSLTPACLSPPHAPLPVSPSLTPAHLSHSPCQDSSFHRGSRESGVQLGTRGCEALSFGSSIIASIPGVSPKDDLWALGLQVSLGTANTCP